MVTYGGMSKKPITVSTSSFIFKVTLEALSPVLSAIFFLGANRSCSYANPICRTDLLFSVNYPKRFALHLMEEFCVARLSI